MAKLGWECPRCNRVWAPTKEDCSFCAKTFGLTKEEIDKLMTTEEQMDFLMDDENFFGAPEC